MPCHVTFEAHFEATGTRRWFIPFFALFNITDTARLGTPSELWIQIYHDIFVKAQVFSINLLRAKRSDVFLSIDLVTAKLHAGDLQHASLSYFAL